MSQTGNVPSLRILAEHRGRALHLGIDQSVYSCKSQAIYRSCDNGLNWSFVTRVPGFGIRGLLGTTRLGARLARYEVRACAALRNGGLVACNREGVYYSAPNETVMKPSEVPVGNLPLSPPMCMYVGPADQIIWGEYDSRDAHGKPVRVYVSRDLGRSFEVAYTFDGGTIRHVHNFLFDTKLDKYWIFVGDVRHEPGIGLMSKDFTDIEWVGRGEQKYRAVEVFDLGDHLVYGTDSELEPNRIVAMDKATGRVDEIQSLEGSCIYACRFGRYYALTTTVEPSGINRSRHAALYLSTDGSKWEKCLSIEKDWWHARYFQFGSIVLPRGESRSDTIILSGQALTGIDGKLMVADWN